MKAIAAFGKLRAFAHDKKAQGAFAGIILMAAGLVALVAMFSIAPLIGHSVDTAIEIPAASEWNATTNTDVPTGLAIWTSNAPLLALVVTVSILVMVIGAIMTFGSLGRRKD